MDQSARTILRAGAKDQLAEDFLAIAQSTAIEGGARYSEKPTLDWLARFITAQAGGPNKDAPLYELCHLVNAVKACGTGTDWISLFFLSGERALPTLFQRKFLDAVSTGGWMRRGFSLVDGGVEIDYGEESFAVRFGRMPVLAALFEFLCTMDGFAFYEDFHAILAEMDGSTVKGIQAASNKLSSHLRQYRRKYIPSAQYEGKFTAIFNFLKERSDESRFIVTDGTILDFWLLHSQGKDFRGYKTVFEIFIAFIDALEESVSREAARGAAPMGIDFDNGEVEPGDMALEDADIGATWSSPFNLFLQEPLCNINFFKKSSEQKPLEPLMEYGPKATALPLAFLRLESFGKVQAGITNDLQVKRGAASVAQRLGCDDAQTYQSYVDTLNALRAHLGDLLRATYHVLSQEEGGNVVAFGPQEPGTIFDAARRRDDSSLDFAPTGDDMALAFKKMTRKGFGEEALGVEGREAFRLAADGLLAMSMQVERFLRVARRLDLATQFPPDKDLFSKQFHTLYGAAR